MRNTTNTEFFTVRPTAYHDYWLKGPINTKIDKYRDHISPFEKFFSTEFNVLSTDLTKFVMIIVTRLSFFLLRYMFQLVIMVDNSELTYRMQVSHCSGEAQVIKTDLLRQQPWVFANNLCWFSEVNNVSYVNNVNVNFVLNDLI